MDVQVGSLHSTHSAVPQFSSVQCTNVLLQRRLAGQDVLLVPPDGKLSPLPHTGIVLYCTVVYCTVLSQDDISLLRDSAATATSSHETLDTQPSYVQVTTAP